MCFFLFKEMTAYERRISDWSSDVCSSDLGDCYPSNAPAWRPVSRRPIRLRVPLPGSVACDVAVLLLVKSHELGADLAMPVQVDLLGGLERPHAPGGFLLVGQHAHFGAAALAQLDALFALLLVLGSTSWWERVCKNV